MPFFMFLPLVVIGIVIMASKKAAEQKKRMQAQNDARERQLREQEIQQQTPNRPTVQAPRPVREAAPAPRPTPSVQPQRAVPGTATSQQMHPKHEDCALRPESLVQPASQNAHPQHEDCALRSEPFSKPESPIAEAHASAQQSSGTILDFTPDNILRGVVFSEIFGKPKALR